MKKEIIKKLLGLQNGEKILKVIENCEYEDCKIYRVLTISKHNLVWLYVIKEYENEYEIGLRLLDTRINGIKEENWHSIEKRYI